MAKSSSNTAKPKAAAAAAAAASKKHPKHESVCSVDPLVDPVFAKGELREYLVTEPSLAALKKRQLLGAKEYWMLSSLLIISLYVRLYNLSYPNSVVFDEVHFGGFARKYILGRFFMDVHPPLAKMLFAAVAAIGGFRGDFEFKSIGDVYPDSTPYVFMRQFPALLGVGTIIFCYLTLRQSGVRPIIAYVTSFLLLIENSNVTISRYILLDSPLMFFIAASIYSWKKFENQIPFTFGWYRGLVATGIALGLAFSAKWVGLFTIAWVGILCVYQMWFIVGDLTISPKKVWGHFFARGTILLGVPIALYVFFFAIHFSVLSNVGDGAAFMSSAFKAGLAGTKIPSNITANVGLGSIVTLRHIETNGGYLHSHDSFYPAGSKQQQITLYPHIDSNNRWFIEPYNGTIYNETFVPLVDGMKIRLKHVKTHKRLHSHDEKAPVSERDWQKEASCYGYQGFEGDPNDDFIVQIVDHRSAPGEAQHKVRAIETVFRLKHAMTGNYLFSSEVKLPEWGYGQQEVTTASSGKRRFTHWYIEENENEWLDPKEADIVNYPVLSLWDKLVESHARMWKINQGLTEHHHWQSNPYEWPLLLRGINYWAREHKQVYFLGNAVTWWAATASIVTFGIYVVVSIFRWQLGQPITKEKHVLNFTTQTFSYVLGWGLHYLPFFIMGRQLFLHHYLPALYFGILSLGHFFEIFTGYIASRSKTLQNAAISLVALFTLLSLVFYFNYSSLIYGTPWTKDACLRSKFVDSWDYDCNAFYTNLSEYNSPQETEVVSSAKVSALKSPEPEPTPSTAEKEKRKEHDPAKDATTTKKKAKKSGKKDKKSSKRNLDKKPSKKDSPIIDFVPKGEDLERLKRGEKIENFKPVVRNLNEDGIEVEEESPEIIGEPEQLAPPLAVDFEPETPPQVDAVAEEAKGATQPEGSPAAVDKKKKAKREEVKNKRPPVIDFVPRGEDLERLKRGEKIQNQKPIIRDFDEEKDVAGDDDPRFPNKKSKRAEPTTTPKEVKVKKDAKKKRPPVIDFVPRGEDLERLKRGEKIQNQKPIIRDFDEEKDVAGENDPRFPNKKSKKRGAFF
ncbi:Dolichyl-phosphate-mannose--protein mannosyltransferase 1 [Spathaspora sp. JA1]|nr:Dolichyl-phosphate-mannose--protein mannosyltransferase 1 [Spathaspora sp. JA1]